MSGAGCVVEECAGRRVADVWLRDGRRARLCFDHTAAFLARPDHWHQELDDDGSRIIHLRRHPQSGY